MIRCKWKRRKRYESKMARFCRHFISNRGQIKGRPLVTLLIVKAAGICMNRVYSYTRVVYTRNRKNHYLSLPHTARYNKRTANWPRSSACTNWLNVNIVGHFARNRDCPGMFVIKTNTGHPISIFRAAKQIEPLHPFEIPAQLHSLRGQPFATGSRLHYVERERGEEGRERNKIR